MRSIALHSVLISLRPIHFFKMYSTVSRNSDHWCLLMANRQYWEVNVKEQQYPTVCLSKEGLLLLTASASSK